MGDAVFKIKYGTASYAFAGQKAQYEKLVLPDSFFRAYRSVDFAVD